MRRFNSFAEVTAIVAVLCLALGRTQSSAAVKAVSTDGEATVYVTGDLSRNFNVSYQAALHPSPGNRSWTTVGVMLLGRANPGPSLEVGLARGPSNALTGFTSTQGVKPRATFKAFVVRCTPGCVLTVRADENAYYASIEGAQVGEWPRKQFDFIKPYIQLNAEVIKPGDSISAVFLPIRLVSNSEPMQSPSCAFTTRGIEPSLLPNGALQFVGTYRRDAPPAFVSLGTRHHGDRCEK